MARTTTARGYGTRHQRERQRWAATVKTGQALCVFCEAPIPPDAPWDLDHTEDRTGWRGPAHRSCNRSAGGTKGAQATNERRAMTTREW